MATQTIDIESDIRKADDNFEQTFGRGNAAGMAELYTKDGMLLPTGSDFVQGKKDIEDFWQGAMEMGIKAAKLKIVEVARAGDTAIEIGRYKLSGMVGDVRDQGKYVVIRK